MQNKLQELTDKLYNEGLAKGKQEAQEMVEKAKGEAEKIISEAKSQASQISADAQKEAEELKTKVENDIKMASTQTLSSLKQQIESLVTAKSINPSTGAAMSDPSFIKKIIETIVKAFNAVNPDAVSLDMILPESMKSELVKFIESGIDKTLSKGINVDFSKKMSNGFSIAPKEGGYFLSFTEKDFEELLGEYLRPATKKILFGE